MTGFTAVLLALGLFIATHSVPAIPPLRRALVARLGERVYLAAYSAVSLAVLVLLVTTVLNAPYVALWPLHPSLAWVPLVVMPVACILLVAGARAPNPLSVAFRKIGFDPQRPGIVGVTRHPILWGFALWAAAHLVPNGDLASLILFGGCAGFALLGMPMIDRRRRRQLGMHEWQALASGSSVIPQLLRVFSRRRSVPVFDLAVGAALFAAMLWLHGPVIGITPFPPTWPF